MIEDFNVITMVASNGKTLYLCEKPTYGKCDYIVCEWTFDYNKAIWFENEEQAFRFAEQYFKTFKHYKIDTVYYKI